MSLNNTPLQGAHINVVSGNFIISQPLGVDDGVDYCHSGRIRRIDEDAIHRQLDSGAIVLMGPVAVSVTGESFNLTSEEVATQLAIKLKAEKMIGFARLRVSPTMMAILFPSCFLTKLRLALSCRKRKAITAPVRCASCAEQ